MSDFQNKRPDSPKGKVWTAFKTKGEKAARRLGEKLEIPAAKLNRWLKDDGKGFQAINDKIRSRKDDDAPASKKNGNGKAPTKKIAAKKTSAKKAVKKAPRRKPDTEETEAREAA